MYGLACNGREKIMDGERRSKRRWLAPLFWAIFAAGLLAQAFAPHLKIQNNAFVIPPSLMSERRDISPEEIIVRERRMQLLSAVLTVGGALGLGVYYRHVLFRRRST